MGGRQFYSGRTIAQGLKITKKKVLPLQLHPHMVRLSTRLRYIRTIKRRLRRTNTFHVCNFNMGH